MLTSNKNSCFSYNKIFNTKLLLQNKQSTCKRRPYYNTVNYLLYREQNKQNNEINNKQVQHKNSF